MKNFTNFLAFFSLILFLFSCETDEPAPYQIEGTYYGTLSTVDGPSKISAKTEDAVAVIRKTGNQEVEVHCYSSEFDTIFRLNYFQHEEAFKVCLTGSDFTAMYHMPYSQPMGMGMGRMHSGSEWMNHLSTMHQEGDPHFGEFNPGNHSFEYHFLMEQSNSSSNLKFRGYRDKN
ncbi:hypothetical protein [Salinimicrobium flavum]|uniref:Lipoprotein n=1 Tax=Salinimicrobium flavum TaxID=1737065 RepID=A0ABW5IU52_9FLAO